MGGSRFDDGTAERTIFYHGLAESV